MTGLRLRRDRQGRVPAGSPLARAAIAASVAAVGLAAAPATTSAASRTLTYHLSGGFRVLDLGPDASAPIPPHWGRPAFDDTRWDDATRLPPVGRSCGTARTPTAEAVALSEWARAPTKIARRAQELQPWAMRASSALAALVSP